MIGLRVHDEITAGFDRWRDLFQRGLTAMLALAAPLLLRQADRRDGLLEAA
jgi:hypothetical protein